MEAQIQIWIKPGEPLTQKAWQDAGFSDLASYISSLEQESQMGHRRNGRPAEESSHLPLVSFGIIEGGVKTQVAVYPTYDTLPTEDLMYDVTGKDDEGNINVVSHYDLIKFDA